VNRPAKQVPRFFPYFGIAHKSRYRGAASRVLNDGRRQSSGDHLDELGSKRALRCAPMMVPRTVLFPSGRPLMSFLMTAAGLILLTGCASLANMRCRASGSGEGDLGVWTALSATRLRVVRPILFETRMIGSISWEDKRVPRITGRKRALPRRIAGPPGSTHGSARQDAPTVAPCATLPA
jgi:hypothetical protein